MAHWPSIPMPRQTVSALELQMNLREENLIKEKKGLLLVKSTYILVLSHLRHYAKQAPKVSVIGMPTIIVRDGWL